MSLASEFQPLKHPQPRRPFVNRESELQLIRDKLQARRPGRPPLNVVCFCGAAGLGKSWLLRKLERQYHRKGRTQAHYPALTALLDAAPEALPNLWDRGRLHVRQVLRETWTQLASQLDCEASELGHVTDEEYARALVNQVLEWLADWTPILMIDTVEAIVHEDEEAFLWLEKHLFEPLALTDQVLLVFASRSELHRWRSFQVRRRVDVKCLHAFDAEYVGAEVEAGPEASAILYRHAFGHPLATEYLGRLLEQQGLELKSASRQQVEATLEPPDLQEVLAQVVEAILERMPADLRPLASVVAILRWVDIEPLRHVLVALHWADAERGEGYYMDLIDRFRAHNLLWYKIDTARYEAGTTLRRLLAHSLEVAEPKSYGMAHLAACEFHRDHLEGFPQFLAQHVPEAAYHRAVAGASPIWPQSAPGFQVWWEGFLARHDWQQTEPWQELAEALEEDSELRQVLSKEEYTILCSTVEERAGSRL